jgi:hypothetical protein
MSLGAQKKAGKRTGENMLFNEVGQLTDETLQHCKMCGVDPKELHPRTVEYFLNKGRT